MVPAQLREQREWCLRQAGAACIPLPPKFPLCTAESPIPEISKRWVCRYLCLCVNISLDKIVHRQWLSTLRSALRGPHSFNKMCVRCVWVFQVKSGGSLSLESFSNLTFHTWIGHSNLKRSRWQLAKLHSLSYCCYVCHILPWYPFILGNDENSINIEDDWPFPLLLTVQTKWH